jgi:hypothetical protein
MMLHLLQLCYASFKIKKPGYLVLRKITGLILLNYYNFKFIFTGSSKIIDKKNEFTSQFHTITAY